MLPANSVHYSQGWADIHKGGPIITRVGQYLQGWADIYKGGPIFTRVGRYSQGWADIHKGGPILGIEHCKKLFFVQVMCIV